MPKQIIEAGTVLYKKCSVPRKFRAHELFDNEAIVSLVVIEPGIMACFEDGQRRNNDDEKCRVRAATVLSVEKCSGGALEYATSLYDPNLDYRVGETVRPTQQFDERDIACAAGIHGFLTRERAVAY